MKNLILRFASKYRVCRRYSPECGTWYVIQVKFLWHWFTSNFAFHDIRLANQEVFYLKENYNQDYICETPLFTNEKGLFEDKYPCKTNYIRLI